MPDNVRLQADAHFPVEHAARIVAVNACRSTKQNVVCPACVIGTAAGAAAWNATVHAFPLMKPNAVYPDASM